MNNTAAAADTSFDDLDCLLNESVTLVKEARAVKENRTALKRSGAVSLQGSERAFIEAKVAEWEAKHTWKTVELVAVFRRQACTCGTHTASFSHFMHHQQHRTDAFAQRWVAASGAAIDSALSRTVAYTDSLTAVCHACAGMEGFNLNDPQSQAWVAQANGGELNDF